MVASVPLLHIRTFSTEGTTSVISSAISTSAGPGVPKLVPLHHLTGILRELLTENVPISDLKRILEELANMSDRNLSITDSAEILRPALSGLLIQQVAPLNSTLPVITLDAELEQMLITTYRQQNESDLIIDTGLIKCLAQIT